MDYFSFASVLLLLLAAILTYIFLRSNSLPGRKTKLPPGPYPFPVVGNIFHLTDSPHKSLTRLSKTYGALMSIHLGRVYTVVISSPEMTAELLHNHDIVVSNRTIPAAAEAHGHHKYSILYMPVGTEWRNLRRICKEQMFSTVRLEAGQCLRQEKLQKMRDYVQKCCEAGRAVNIGESAFITTLNLMSATLFSAEFTSFDSEDTQEFKEAIEGVTNCLGSPNLANFFPILKPFDPQGVKRKAEVFYGQLLGIMEDRIQERLKSRTDSSKMKDLLETLLDLSQGSQQDLTLNDIKHFLMVKSPFSRVWGVCTEYMALRDWYCRWDLIIGGSYTSSSSTEWVMTELLRHPEILSKAKAELMDVIGEGQQAQESDISRLPYLQAVIKEGLRCHPTGPLLIPRISDADIRVGGYSIPKGTQIIINVYAMGRDPNVWTNPDAFEPERFMGSNIDFKGQHFQLIPFGSGRRICPGISLASRMVHTMVATLIHNFDWKLESGLKPEQVDVREKFGLALTKLVPLKAIPIKP